MHEINQQAVKLEITFVCPKSWHSVLKRKKKAQMSSHQKIHLCGEKKRRGVDRKSRRHNTFLFARLSASTDVLCIGQNGDQTSTSGRARAVPLLPAALGVHPALFKWQNRKTVLCLLLWTLYSGVLFGKEEEMSRQASGPLGDCSLENGIRVHSLIPQLFYILTCNQKIPQKEHFKESYLCLEMKPEH